MLRPVECRLQRITAIACGAFLTGSRDGSYFACGIDDT